jgi:hypothetical protein
MDPSIVNLVKTNVDNKDSNSPEGCLGTSILRILKRDNTLKHLNVTSQCVSEIELMSHHVTQEEDDLRHKRVNCFFEQLGMTDDTENDSTMIGTWIAECRGIHTIEIKSHPLEPPRGHPNTDVIDDDDLTGFFEQLKDSKSIQTVHFNGCQFHASTEENAINLLSIPNTTSLKFTNCTFKIGGSDIFVAPMHNLKRLCFEECIFERGIKQDIDEEEDDQDEEETNEDTHCVMYITTMKNLEQLSFIRCNICAEAMKIIIRDIKRHHKIKTVIHN